MSFADSIKILFQNPPLQMKIRKGNKELMYRSPTVEFKTTEINNKLVPNYNCSNPHEKVPQPSSPFKSQKVNKGNKKPLAERKWIKIIVTLDSKTKAIKTNK